MATHQEHFVDLVAFEAGIAERLPARIERPLNQLFDQLFELLPSQREVEMLRPRGVRHDERQIDVGLRRRRQLVLGLFGGLFEPLQGHLVVAKVGPRIVFRESVGEVVDDIEVEFVAAQVRVTVRGLTSKTPSPSSRIEISKVPVLATFIIHAHAAMRYS